MAAVSGCSLDAGDAADPADASPLSAAEVGWIRGYAILTIAIYDDDLPGGGLRSYQRS